MAHTSNRPVDWEALVTQNEDRLYRAALAILGHPQEAEDAVQNAFMQVIRHFEKIYEIPCEELPFWLISIVKNEALMICVKVGILYH